MITPKNIIRHELIGLKAEIVKSKNKSLIGLKGKIIDETRSMLTIETNKGEKKIIKKGCTLKIKLNKEVVEIDGALLVGRPEKRIKKKVPKKRV